MKKKFLAVALAAVSVCALSVGLTACGGEEAKTYEGEYHYASPWSATAPDYGVKVKVTVTGGKIDKVEIVESDYVQVTETWTDKQTYLDGEKGLLDSFAGKTVEAVMDYEVKADGQNKGEPTAVTAEGLKVITGATQSTGRLILAVQDALADVE